jgi:hypothetical protein
LKDKERAMRVGARFPHALWPEIGKTAVYLYNRTPNYGDSDTRWESPYTRFRRAVSLARGMPNTKETKKWPDQTHLVAFGCKAYAIISDAQFKKKRKWRLAPKAWIGYMIDYRSSNSYRIWLFIKNKIIIIYNVIFNENEFSIGDFELFKNELMIINTEAFA